ncbi:hypothetical protein ES703_53969 [subsurface metagenome]
MILRVGTAGIDGASPGWYTVINEIGKVRLWVISIRHRNAEPPVICDCDTVAYQSTVSLQSARQLHGIDIITGGRVAIGTIIVHCDRSPIRRTFISRVRRVIRESQGNITAGIDKLVMQGHRSHTVRVGDLGGNGCHLDGGGHFGRVFYLANMRRNVVGINRRVLSRRGRISRTPAAPQVIIKKRINQLHGVACAVGRIDIRYGVTHGRPRKAELIIHLVDFLSIGIAQLDLFAVIVQATLERAENQFRRYAEFVLNLSRVLSHHNVSTCRQCRAGWKLVGNTIAEIPAGKVNVCCSRVIQFDKLYRFGLDIRVVVNLVDCYQQDTCFLPVLCQQGKIKQVHIAVIIQVGTIGVRHTQIR